MIQKLKNNEKAVEWIRNHSEEVELIFLNGSRSLDVAETDSDYDLTCVVRKGDYYMKDSRSIVSEEEKMHWYYGGLNYVCGNPRIYGNMSFAGIMSISHLDDSKVIYSKDNRFLQFMKDNKDEIVLLGLQRMAIFDKAFLQEMVNFGTVPKENNNKYFYSCLFHYMYIFEEQNVDRELVKSYKNHLKTTMTVEDQLRCAKYAELILDCAKDEENVFRKAAALEQKISTFLEEVNSNEEV